MWTSDEVMARREMFSVVIDFIRSQKRYCKACLTSSMENEKKMRAEGSASPPLKGENTDELIQSFHRKGETENISPFLACFSVFYELNS